MLLSPKIKCLVLSRYPNSDPQEVIVNMQRAVVSSSRISAVSSLDTPKRRLKDVAFNAGFPLISFGAYISVA